MVHGYLFDVRPTLKLLMKYFKLTLCMNMSCCMNTAQVFKFERHIKTVQLIKVTFRAPLIFDSDVAINQVLSK